MRKPALTITLIGLLLTSVSGGRYQGQSDPKPSLLLAPAPAPVSAGASITALVPLVGAPNDSVFALRGGGTTDFWHYSISQNEWTVLPGAPAPVGEGSRIVEVHSYTACQSGRAFQVAALRGGNTTDFWQFNIEKNSWCVEPGTPAPVGAGGAIAQLQRIGKIYVLRGSATTDFWSLENGQWKTLASTPGPVNVGGGLVGINYGTFSQRDVLYALQGDGLTAVWKYDVDKDRWTHQSDAPAPIGVGGAITAPNYGGEGTLDILQGGGSTTVWSLDVETNSWKTLAQAPGAVAAGGAASNQFNGCDFAFVGGESTQFFATGLHDCIPGITDFSLRLDQPTITAARGTKVKVRLSVVRSGNFTGDVRVIAPETLPAGIKLPESLPPGPINSAAFKIKIKDGAASGTYQLTFTGTDNAGNKRTATLTLIVAM